MRDHSKGARGRWGEDLACRELHRAGAPPERIEHAPSERAAAERALAWAEPGDLLLLFLHAQRSEILEELQARAGV